MTYKDYSKLIDLLEEVIIEDEKGNTYSVKKSEYNNICKEKLVIRNNSESENPPINHEQLKQEYREELIKILSKVFSFDYNIINDDHIRYDFYSSDYNLYIHYNFKKNDIIGYSINAKLNPTLLQTITDLQSQFYKEKEVLDSKYKQLGLVI